MLQITSCDLQSFSVNVEGVYALGLKVRSSDAVHAGAAAKVSNCFATYVAVVHFNYFEKPCGDIDRRAILFQLNLRRFKLIYLAQVAHKFLKLEVCFHVLLN